MRFCDRLREQRKRMDMTQEQVAKSLNIVRSTYAYYETGKTCPDFATVVRIAHLFNVTTDYLLGANTPSPQLHDEPSSYNASLQKAISGEWSLRESEQKLIMAFRYLNKEMQANILASVEKAASEQYEQRRLLRQKKGDGKAAGEGKPPFKG
ncbi:MAG TPA: helix-turn-helix transcriptional regulator [Firmicutes bacterium]|nr:helix-turn-helix transcriptional regulator [Bacillota bacterium]